MNNDELDILYGALLGDGSIYKGKNNINYRFSYSSKYLNHVDYVCNFLKEYCTGEYLTFRHRFDKRTQKYYDCY